MLYILSLSAIYISLVVPQTYGIEIENKREALLSTIQVILDFNPLQDASGKLKNALVELDQETDYISEMNDQELSQTIQDINSNIVSKFNLNKRARVKAMLKKLLSTDRRSLGEGAHRLTLCTRLLNGADFQSKCNTTSSLNHRAN